MEDIQEDKFGEIKERISNLPGLKAQLFMAPKLREQELIEISNYNGGVKSAVLIVIYSKNSEIEMILTRRSSRLKKHSGQISFPGGKMDYFDVDLESTALREASEEIGIDTKELQIIGKLTDLKIPISGFEVSPFVAYANEEPELKINAGEVDSVIKVRISNLCNISNIKRKNFGIENSTRLFDTPYFDINGEEIWGATAMIVSELLICLFPESDFSKLYFNSI